MRKTLIAILSLMVLSSALIAPAVAGKRKAKKVTREVTGIYDAPALGILGAGFTNCATPAVGCVVLQPGPKEVYLSVAITDSAGQKVSANITQDTNADMLADTSEPFCGETAAPVAIDSSYPVNVMIFTGPCSDATPAVATNGTVTGTFSNLP